MLFGLNFGFLANRYMRLVTVAGYWWIAGGWLIFIMLRGSAIVSATPGWALQVVNCEVVFLHKSNCFGAVIHP